MRIVELPGLTLGSGLFHSWLACFFAIFRIFRSSVREGLFAGWETIWRLLKAFHNLCHCRQLCRYNLVEFRTVWCDSLTPREHKRGRRSVDEPANLSKSLPVCLSACLRNLQSRARTVRRTVCLSPVHILNFGLYY
jgi:hypothetical protein